jgi:hypothetical protein
MRLISLRGANAVSYADADGTAVTVRAERDGTFVVDHDTAMVMLGFPQLWAAEPVPAVIVPSAPAPPRAVRQPSALPDAPA